MQESVVEATAKDLTGHRDANIGIALDNTVALGSGDVYSTSHSYISTEPQFDQMALDQETLVSAVSSSRHSTTPVPSISERREITSPPIPPEARLETGFDSSDSFESAAHRDSDTMHCTESVPRVKAQDSLVHGRVASSKLSLRQSLGIFSCVTIFGGSALTLLAVAFLLFLWAGGGPVEGGTEAPSAWRVIMLRGWATQSVTLTSLLLRVISAAQAGLCTSLVAALLLERRGVPISKAVQFSVTRTVNVGPMEFLYMTMSRRVRKAALKIEILLLFLLASTAIGLQFSSTILISDFGTTGLVQNSNRTIINVAMSPRTASNLWSTNVFSDSSIETVLFGEVDSKVDPTPNHLGISDTGTKRRAFLPFQKEDRINLQYFSGAAFSSVSRVACIRPSMIARLRYTSTQWLSIEGTINYNQSLQDAGQSTTQRCYESSDNVPYCLPTTFNCSLPGSRDPSLYPQWPTAICHLVLNSDDYAYNMPTWNQYSSPFDFPSGSWAHLVFATNIPTSYWKHIERSAPVTLGEPAPYGEWVSHEIEAGMFLNTTFCFSAVNTTVSSVTMTGNINQIEPPLQWNTTKGSFEVNTLQTIFGAESIHKTPAQRGIISIIGDVQDPASPSAFNVNSTLAQDTIRASSKSFSYGAGGGVWQNSLNGLSVALCTYCLMEGSFMSDDMSAIFERIINTTGRAATAVDTYLAMLTRSCYYSYLPKFDVPGYIDVAFVTEVLLPIRWRGLTAVLVLVGVNAVLMWFIAVLYIRRTRFTLAGNYWHAVAQLISKDMVPLLEKGREMKDEDLTEQLDLESEDFLVKIERSPQDGLVTVVKV
ncbi:hypothetical protein NUW58_g1967 [Xylaria curta]|uniref:Uncharacterized protein n=1 Tax=Xylaria curta TaxID=42375 RepID=A0ACC1PHU7_9PEZI|nr:hypothetical protein NUW58_g1967 [Xylaria curta]